MEILTSMIKHLIHLVQEYSLIKIIPHEKLGSPWGIWMVHWTIIGTLPLCQVLCTINQWHSICWHSQVLSYPDSFPIFHTRGLSQSVRNIDYRHTSKHTISCTITGIWRQNQKVTCKNTRTPQTSHQKTHYCFFSWNYNTYYVIYLPLCEFLEVTSATSIYFYTK